MTVGKQKQQVSLVFVCFFFSVSFAVVSLPTCRNLLIRTADDEASDTTVSIDAESLS